MFAVVLCLGPTIMAPIWLQKVEFKNNRLLNPDPVSDLPFSSHTTRGYLIPFFSIWVGSKVKFIHINRPKVTAFFVVFTG